LVFGGGGGGCHEAFSSIIDGFRSGLVGGFKVSVPVDLIVFFFDITAVKDCWRTRYRRIIPYFYLEILTTSHFLQPFLFDFHQLYELISKPAHDSILEIAENNHFRLSVLQKRMRNRSRKRRDGVIRIMFLWQKTPTFGCV